MKLSRITSEFLYGDWIIHKFGIGEDGSPIHNTTKFRDWFYFKADQIGQLSRFDKIDIDIETVYKSIYGEDCYKIFYTSTKERKLIDDAFPEYTYEADVKPEFKYLMTTNLKWADARDRNICYYDIETFLDEPSDGETFSTPSNPFAPITSIQVYSTKLDKYLIFTWHCEETASITKPVVIDNDGVSYVFCRDEADVIISFFEFMKMYNVDILAGWYSKQFDLPYICERCNRLNIDYNQMSPINRVAHYNHGFEWKTFIDGIDHIDMMDAVAEVGYNLPNNKLATAAKEILNDPDTEKLTEVTWRDWKDNFSGFMRYGLRDVKILKRIDEELGIMDLFCTVQKITNMLQLNDISFKSSVIDKFIMSECKNEYVFPTRHTATKEQYKGAHVLDPKPGLFKDVGIVDYASLYPTSVMSFNLSPETLICSQEEIEKLGLSIENVISELNKSGTKYVDTGFDEELVGKRYLFYAQSSKLGVLPKILKKMYEERVRIKGEMKLETDPIHKNALDKHQYALKIILNSAYGAFGFNFFRLYKVEVADAITFFARRALDFAISGLENDNYEVIYGDTDSCFFVHNRRDIESWLNNFNESLKTTFIPTYNNGTLENYLMMQLEYEKDFERIYFGDSKKRYYGIERNTGKKYIKGLNIIRKDAPPFLKDRLNLLTETAITSGINVNDLMELRREVESQPYDSIGITKAFGKPFSEYKVKANHIEGAKYANEHLGTKITHTDTPLLFYIISHCENDLKPKSRHNTICLLPEHLHFIDERKDIFEIDYTEYFSKQVIQQLEEFKYIPSVGESIKQYKESLK